MLTPDELCQEFTRPLPHNLGHRKIVLERRQRAILRSLPNLGIRSGIQLPNDPAAVLGPIGVPVLHTIEHASVDQAILRAIPGVNFQSALKGQFSVGVDT